jgi:hypothetical protein
MEVNFYVVFKVASLDSASLSTKFAPVDTTMFQHTMNADLLIYSCNVFIYFSFRSLELSSEIFALQIP